MYIPKYLFFRNHFLEFFLYKDDMFITFPVFIFNIRSFKDVASSYSLGILAQRNGDLFDLVSNPYLTVFLFSLDISWKFPKLYAFSCNIKTFP